MTFWRRGSWRRPSTAVRAATSLTCSLGVAPCKVVAKVASDARKPGGLVVVPRGREASFLAPLAVRRLPGVGPKAEERLHAAGIETIGESRRADGRGPAPPSAGQRRHDAPRPSPRDRPARARARRRADLASASRTRSSGTSPTASACTTSSAKWPRSLRARCRRRGQAREDGGQQSSGTPTSPSAAARLPWPRESTTAKTIRDITCSLLDRGLCDRPGALRLVGVGVSGLADFVSLCWRRSKKQDQQTRRSPWSSGRQAPPRSARRVQLPRRQDHPLVSRVKKGAVISERPRIGSRQKRGAKVSLVVSRGKRHQKR